MMALKKPIDVLTELFSVAGIRVNGNHPWDIHIHNDAFYARVMNEGSLGAGESYMEGWWDCQRLDEFFTRLFKADIESHINTHRKILADLLLTRMFNRQSVSRAFHNGQKHYDIGNDLFVRMLDKRMTYSCGYWKDTTTLDEAQEKKLDLTCRKLYLQPGMEVLDIGCGWGSFALFAAEHYGVNVTGITVSKEQLELGHKLCADLPIDLKLMDYRALNGTYDRIVSLGMMEHVGHKNYRRFMQIVHDCLKEEGLFLLHTIGGNTSETSIDPWIDKYIFPGSMLPSVKQIGQAIEGLFVLEDWHNFGADYDNTLLAWHDNFVNNWDTLKDRYDETFFRMWKYYLLICAGTFRVRKNQLWQIVLSKNGVTGGYDSIR